LVNAIRPAVEATLKGDLEATTEANVKDVVQALRTSTPILKPKVDSGELRVVGANYSLDSGSVTFLDEQ
jgi:carbonic anhydrase